jgi:hypothetical protein
MKKIFNNKEEWRKNISESLKGEKHPMFGKESWNKGKTFQRSDETKQLLKQNAFNRKRYICPLCQNDNLDGGNLSKHMTKTHDWTKDQVVNFKEGK